MMVSQPDRELIRSFVSELEPYLATIERGVREFAQPVPNGVVVGQAIQALGMVRGAGSMLQSPGLVTVADLLAEAFDTLRLDPRLPAGEAYHCLDGLSTALRELLDAIDMSEDTAGIVLRAQEIFGSIPESAPRHQTPPGTCGPDRLGVMRESRAFPVEPGEPDGESGNEAGFEHEHQVPPRPDEADTQKLVALDNTGEGRETGAPDVDQQDALAGVAEDGPPEQVDSGEPDAFVEEIAGLLGSFGDEVRRVAGAPDDFDGIDRLRQIAHTIEATSDVVGFPMIGQVGSAVEQLLASHVDHRIAINRDTLEFVLVAWKMLRAMIARLDDLSPFASPAASVVQRSDTLQERLDGQTGRDAGMEPDAADEAQAGQMPQVDDPAGDVPHGAVGPVDPAFDLTEFLITPTATGTAETDAATTTEQREVEAFGNDDAGPGPERGEAEPLWTVQAPGPTAIQVGQTGFRNEADITTLAGASWTAPSGDGVFAEGGDRKLDDEPLWQSEVEWYPRVDVAAAILDGDSIEIVVGPSGPELHDEPVLEVIWPDLAAGEEHQDGGTAEEPESGPVADAGSSWPGLDDSCDADPFAVTDSER